MAAILFTVYFAIGGIIIIDRLYPDKTPLTRLWLGLCLGVIAEMWLPALLAYAFRFSIQAHISAAVLYLIPVTAVCRLVKKTPQISVHQDSRTFLRIFLILTFVFTSFSGYLQYTHMLKPAPDGSYWCGQSTYGDLCMHLSFMTSLRNAEFPPSYNLLYGTALAYPYLTDSLSTTFLLMGMPISLAVSVPGTYLMFLTYAGFLLLARRVMGNRPLAICMAFLFFFMNGGLGFLYDFDLAYRDNFARVSEIFTGYYKTPANQPDLNLRFSNVVVDLMIPQRSLLGGWALVLPAFYFLMDAFENRDRRALLLLCLFAGGLPLVHTHTFLALGLFSGGYILAHLISDKDERRQVLLFAGIYLGAVLAMGLPQLLGNAIRQTVEGGSLRLQFNWVNNSGGRGFIDEYFWFWIKNAGLPYILMLCAILNCRRRRKGDIVLGMMFIYAVAEIILFQPNEYDNNKLFYLWYVFAVILAADYGSIIMKRLEGLRGRYLLAGIFVWATVFSGGLSMAREAVSGYQLFSSTAVDAGEWIDENTDRDAVFLTGFQHINPVCSLAGRQIICGSDLYVFFHGLDYSQQKADCIAFYSDPEDNMEILDEYGIDYIYVSDYERAELDVNLEVIENSFECVYENRDVKIFRTGLQQ